jgi:hypothetical protein
MLPQHLPKLEGTINNGADIRYDTADAISFVEVAAKRAASGVTSAHMLRDFYIAAANAADKAAGGSGDAVKIGGVTLNANQVVVTNGDSIIVHTAAGAVQAGSPATAEVVTGVLTDVKLGA